MWLLVTGLIVFLGVHLVPALPTVRGRLVARLGEQRYKGVFSLVSFAGIALIIAGYAYAPRGERLFPSSQTAIMIAPYAITLASVLFAAANLRGHTRRLLKHPMLLGLSIWAAVHLAANGDERGTLVFGSFLAYAVIDFASVVQRGATASFTPSPRHDIVAVTGGVVVALAVMALHRVLFGLPAVRWGW